MGDAKESVPGRQKKPVLLADKLPAHILREVRKEIAGIASDMRALKRFELHKLRPETQLQIANTLRGHFDPDAPADLKGWSVQFGVIDFKHGGLKVKVWTRDVTDPAKETGVMLKFELIDF